MAEQVTDGQLRRAWERYMDRKDAIMGEVDGGSLIPDDEAESVLRRLLSGFDIDLNELNIALRLISDAAVTTILRDQAHPKAIIEGAWIDGLVVGMTLRDIQREDEAK